MYCGTWREDLLCLGNCVEYTTLFTVSPSTHFMNSSLAQHLVSFRRHSGWFLKFVGSCEINLVFAFDHCAWKLMCVRIFSVQPQFSWKWCSFHYWHTLRVTRVSKIRSTSLNINLMDWSTNIEPKLNKLKKTFKID